MTVDIECARCGSKEAMGYVLLISNNGEPLADNMKTMSCGVINLRHTSKYKYSNIFMLIHITGPDGKKITERREFKLALPDGEWLGSGSGDIYSYQLLFKKSYKFPVKGSYIFELEQNMRDNPLDGVSDAGIRIEKAN